jgi:hypothetical protein
MDKLKTHKILKNHIEILKDLLIEKKQLKNRIKELEENKKKCNSKNNRKNEENAIERDINMNNRKNERNMIEKDINNNRYLERIPRPRLIITIYKKNLL